jgi:hypothetical protein
LRAGGFGLAALVAGAVLLGALLSNPGDARARLLEREPGAWTLDDLGARESIRLTDSGDSHTIPFELPPGARQGPRLWYVVALRVRATFPKGTSGTHMLGAGINGRAVAQIFFRVTPREVMANGLGLVTGDRVDRTPRRTITTTLVNYAQYSAIRPGRNTLEFGFDTLRGPKPERLEILSESTLELTSAHPDELQLQGPRRPVTVTAGREFSVPFRVTRRGGRADVAVRARFASMGPGLKQEGGSGEPFRVGGGHTGEIRLRADRPGRYFGTITILGAYNEPSGSITVVAQPPGQPGRRISVTAVLSLVAGTALLVTVVRRRRRRP